MLDHPWESEPVLVFTSDVDWASEAGLIISDSYFADAGVKVTYFMTNPSLSGRGSARETHESEVISPPPLQGEFGIVRPVVK